MKGKLAFLLGMALGQCFVWGRFELGALEDACVWGRDFPDLWLDAFKKTQEFVKTTLSDTKYKFNNSALIALWTFLEHNEDFKTYLKDFKAADGVSDVDYKAWAKDLFLLEYKAANFVDAILCNDEAYFNLVSSSANDILTLFENPTFKNTNNKMKKVLDGNIHWGDE